jgi:hypothetical protein
LTWEDVIMISILALGSKGDVLPLAAQGKGLLQAAVDIIHQYLFSG